MRKSIFFLMLMLLASAASAKQFAIANIENNGLPENQAKVVTNALRSHVMRVSNGDQVPPATMIGVQGSETTTNAKKIISLGEQVDAKTIAAGVIKASGDKITLTVTLYDVESESKLGTLTTKTTDGFGGLMKSSLSEMAEKIVNHNFKVKQSSKSKSKRNVEKQEEHVVAPEPIVSSNSSDAVLSGLRTTLVVSTQPTGAAVLLDGSYIGVSSVLQPTTTGIHEIALSLDGYNDTTFYAVFDGENNLYNVPLYANETANIDIEKSSGISTKSIIRIATVIIGAGSAAGGFVMNNQVDDLNTKYDQAKSESVATSIGEDRKSKANLRNILYGVSGAAFVGLGVTFVF